MQQEKFGWTEVGGDFHTPDGKFQYLSICSKPFLLLWSFIDITVSNRHKAGQYLVKQTDNPF